MEILKRINQPSDLKDLSNSELQHLAQEIREELLEVISSNGGHLAPNLGVVELTLALHRIFDSPQDKLLWDVGHQSYPHKILTGRQKEFKSLRLYNGLSGFPKQYESPHDCFETGHSSTSISAALGFAKARDLKKESCHIVAIIGDGAMSGGMAYEALNHAGHIKSRMIVVLNDNKMSISDNVGALASYLSRLRTNSHYDFGKKEVKNLLKQMPLLGSKMIKAVGKAKGILKYLLVPGQWFEELGFTYLGPIDGHNQFALERVFEQAKQVNGPVLIHTLTKKGKGYQPAENNPDIFHGIEPFNKQTGELIKKNDLPTFTKIFGETLCQLAEKEPKVVAITAAMPSGTGLIPFSKKFPERYFDVGIAEQHAVTFASALSLSGLKPVVSVYSTFYQRAYDQVLHDVCLQEANVVLAIDQAGVVGEDGPTHHGVFDISFLRVIPNLTLMAPKDENELRHMLNTALKVEGPIALRYPRSVGLGVKIDETLKEIPIGKAEVLREGKDLTIIGIGPMVYTCLAAAQELCQQGVETSVINLRFINPLDHKTILHYAKMTKRIITVEDHMLAGGIGSAVLEILADEKLTDVVVERLGYHDYVAHGAISILHQTYGLSVKGILSAVERMKVLQ